MNYEYEQALRLASEAMWTIKLQHRRLQSKEPEDQEFVTRRVADWHFFIVALTRFRRAACLASSIEKIRSDVKKLLGEFDSKLPSRKSMRNIAEHIDEYAIGRGNDKEKDRRGLEVIRVSGTDFNWMEENINSDDALAAANALWHSIVRLRKKAMGNNA